MFTNRWTLLSLGIATAASLVACGPVEKEEGESADVSHETARQAISANTGQTAERIASSLQFLEDSELFAEGFEVAASSGGGTAGCAPQPIDSTEEPAGDTDCQDVVEEPAEFDSDVADDAQALTDYLENAIFVDANIESETSKSVTYLLDGQTVCGYETDTPDSECVQQVDDSEIRLYVTSPQEGDIDVSVQIGPQKHNPVYFEFYATQLAIEVDLGGVKGAAQHITSVTGEEAPDLPQTMTGRMRAELKSNPDDTLTGAISVLQAIDVADGDYGFAVAQSIPTFEVTADPANETLDAMLDLGAVDGKFPVYEIAVDSNGNETRTKTSYAFHLGGLSSSTVLRAASDVLDITNIGLGDTTTTLDVNGNRVLAADLNENSGRRYDATVTMESDGSVRYEVSPEIDLRVVFSFINAADDLENVADWMLDDVLRVTLDGAAKPTLLFHDDGAVEVVDGELDLSLANAGISHTASAGMCVLETADVATSTGEDTSTGDESSSNPLENLEVTTCQ